MPGSPLRRQRKAGAVDPVTGEHVPFPRLNHPRAGVSHAEWRALEPGEKIERLLGMPLGRAAEIMSWPLADCDPAWLAVKMQVWRVVFIICIKAVLDGTLDREAARKRERQRILSEMTRREFGDRHRTGTGKTGPRIGGREKSGASPRP